MPEIGTSGSMSGEGQRSDAGRLKLPRPSSTLLRHPSEIAAVISLVDACKRHSLSVDEFVTWQELIAQRGDRETADNST